MKRAAFFLLALCACRSAQEIYELILKGGHVIDPKNKRNGKLDIAISGGRVRKIARSIPAAQGRATSSTSEIISLHQDWSICTPVSPPE